eukprot:CAMPEP_0173326968 /NCGR_PEP_ID=MMETSP1144-20121109/1352_1 /TAXON_ID=483371 /ORGANISM="non described non described, Strain CCMP2298" /LENGTH=996 /DNA_ID=CAMNT_0014271321 /DNA_START=561 /DNA_END=3549 /DNA_ORIENTATION=-
MLGWHRLQRARQATSVRSLVSGRSPLAPGTPHARPWAEVRGQGRGRAVSRAGCRALSGPFHFWEGANKTPLGPLGTRAAGGIGGPGSAAGAGAGGSEQGQLVRSILSRYFDAEDLVQRKQGVKGAKGVRSETLSPEVISSMVRALVSEKGGSFDHGTVDMLVEQGVRQGAACTASLDQLVDFHLEHGRLAAAADVLRKCDPQRIKVSEVLCGELLQGLVERCNWTHAHLTIMYMIGCDHSFRQGQEGMGGMDVYSGDVGAEQSTSYGSHAVFFTVGGLLSNSQGVVKVLELVELIALKRRGDLAGLFSFNKANRFSMSMAGSGAANRAHPSRNPLPAASVERACEALIGSLKGGWFSFSLAKMLVGLACAADHGPLAADFVRNAVAAVGVEDAKAGEGAGKGPGAAAGGDVLSLVRSFAQGDGVAQRRSYYDKSFTEYSPVTLALLDLLWAPVMVAQSQAEQLRERGRKGFEKGQGGAGRMAMALEVCASQGPLRCSDLLNCYWVLAHRARNVAMDLPAYARDTPLDALQQVDASTRQLYEQLRQFWSDRDGFAEFRPRGGFERRAFRVLCNEFGFRHKVVRVTNTATNMSTWEHVDSYETVVKVWKPPNVPTDFEPPSFEELIARDANLNPNQRNLDGEPLYWPQACAALDVMDEEKLAVVVGRLGNAMKNYASTSWMLLFADKLREREVPLPLGLLRSIMKMAAERNDLYGLLEVLHLCLQEKEIAEQSKELKLSPYAQNLQRIRLRPRYHSSTQRSSRRHQQPTDGPSFAGVETDEDEDDVGPEPGLGPDASRLVDSLLATEEEGQVDVWALEFDSLTKHDWNRACLLAFRGKQSHVPLESYKEAFTEVMVLMRQCGVELEKDSLQTLMRFLVFSNHNPDLLWKLVKRMHKDKSIEISHVECVALTQLVARQLHPAHRGYLQLVLPMYQSQNYLHAFPETLHQISGLVVRNAYHLGPDFLRSFESAWASLQTARGRNSLHKMMTRLLDDSTQA